MFHLKLRNQFNVTLMTSNTQVAVTLTQVNRKYQEKMLKLIYPV